MAQTFPLSLADFALTLPVKHFAWKLQEQQDVDGLAGGNPLVADIGPRFWKARVQLDSMWHQEAAEIQATIESLDGGLSKFYFHDPRTPFPADDPKGLILAAGTAVAVGGEAGYGSIPTGTYRAEGNAITLSQSFSVVSDAGTYFDSYGMLQLAAANVPRIDYGPFLNLIPNPKAAGATVGMPGGLPSGWSLFKDAGISYQIVQTGVIDGIEGIRIRFWGTPSATGDILMRFENSVIAAVAGPQTAALSVKQGGGLLTNVGVARIVCQEYTSGNAYVGSSTGGTMTFGAAWARFSSSALTAVGAAGNYIRDFMSIGHTAGQAIDVTIDIGFPTLERAASASAYPRAPISMLAEPAAANKLVRSREFDNASWVKTALSVTANVASIIDPWGTQLADKLVENNAAGGHNMNQAYTTTNYVNHVGYVLAKAGERTKLKLELSNFSTAACSAFFDLVAGTVSGVSSGTGDFTGASARIVDLGRGWFWCEIEALKTSGDNDCVMTINLCDASGNASYTGDGVSGLYLAHAQLDEGVIGRMPIVTTTAAVARAADQPTFKGKGVNDFLLTFDDNSTQTVNGVSANWSPASSSFSRSRIRSWAATRRIQPAAEPVRIAEVSMNNKEFRLKGLPSGYRLGRSGMFHRDYGANPVHRGLYRTHKKPVTADAAGETDFIEFRPHFIPASAAVDDVISLAQPAALCMIVPGSFNEGQPAGQRNYNMSFDIIQVP